MNLPTVSICTPTHNRRAFWPTLLQIVQNQDYPHSYLEWVVVDDGTDKIRDVIESAQPASIDVKYVPVEGKLPLGRKRNLMHAHASGDVLVYFDDDDYYPPNRVSHAVSKLVAAPRTLCAGSTEMYMWFQDLAQMYQAGPYNQNHATAGTFAFRRELLKHTSYDDLAAVGEEKHFLKNYTIPMVQLDPLSAILVFPHSANTYDKRQMIGRPGLRPSAKTVEDFIRQPHEAGIKKFFTGDMHVSL